MSARDGAALRALPSVHVLLGQAERAGLLHAYSAEAVTQALRNALEAARAAIRSGGAAPDASLLVERAAGALARAALPGRRVVINATGIVLHTNLGRAKLAAEAVEAMGAASGYLDLEFDVRSGGRGKRIGAIEGLLRELVSCEAAVAVNNCAAAVLLALSAHAAGGEVVVSRGELVEIGGGFRVPDIIASGGARLVEVGTTNRTRLADYERAIGPATRMLLKVHRSNFRMTGFVEDTGLEALAGLAAARGLPLMQDLGCGALVDLGGIMPGRTLRETTVGEAVRHCALVAFSGDKLMGGPQAGLVVGTEAAIAPLRSHPLMRAVRLDKSVLAALDATLRLYRDRDRVVERVPVLRMLGQGEEVLARRAARLAGLLADVAGVSARVMASSAEAGGGTLPGETMPSRAVAVAVAGMDAEALARGVRSGRPAVVGRVADGSVVLDVFAIEDGEVEAVAEAVAGVAARVGRD